MINNLKFDLKHIANQGVGAKETYSFDLPVQFEGVKPLSNLVGSVTIMKLEDLFHDTIDEITLTVELICTRSLKPFSHEITVKSATREFYIDMPTEITDINDLFLIDKKRLQIDLNEMIRQEINLHFPAVPVHYEGSDELIKQYQTEAPAENKPLAILKDLLK